MDYFQSHIIRKFNKNYIEIYDFQKISPTPKPVFLTPAPQSKILGATLLPGGNPIKYPLRLAVPTRNYN